MIVPQVWVTRAIGALVVAAALWVGGSWVKARWDELEALRDYKTVTEAQARSTNEIAQQVSDALGARTKTETVIYDRRAASEERFEELKNEHPHVRDWADTPIPDELRNDGAQRGRAVD